MTASSRGPLCVGTRLTIDGEAITVTGVEGASVAGFDAGGEPVAFVLTPVAVAAPARPVNEQWRFGAVVLDAGALSDAQLREAAEMLAHLNEASFGYRSGDSGRPAPGEPRREFDPGLTTLGARLRRRSRGVGGEIGIPSVNPSSA